MGGLRFRLTLGFLIPLPVYNCGEEDFVCQGFASLRPGFKVLLASIRYAAKRT